MNLVDTSGWLEYFTNGPNANNFAKPIEDSKNLIVSVINVYEVYKKVFNEKDENSAIQAIGILLQSEVINVDEYISIDAAKISCNLKIPMADSIIIASAKSVNAVIWTQDSDFKNLPNVKYFPKV
jgi:predicted nucleic acid-binding protein